MATVSSTSSYTGNLSTYFTTLIENIMAVERQPLERLTTQLDTLNVRSGIYTDVKSMLSNLQTAAYNLTSTSYAAKLIAGRTAEVSGVDDGTTVLTATASKNAVAGTYNITDISLALQHRISSDSQTYTDQALGYSGSILVGGASTSSAIPVSAMDDTITGFGTAGVASGQSQLGSGSYFVETREVSEGVWQFRLVDDEGKAMKIRDNSEEGEYTDDWQNIPDGGGAYDTGRGLTISFGTNSELFIEKSRGGNPNPASELTYVAQGATIDVEETDSLEAIASKINDADLADGNGITATIIGGQLILTTDNTGADQSVEIYDVSSGRILKDLGILTETNEIKNELQGSKNATFKVNNIAIERTKNTGLTNVISGLTLNLAADAEGKDATITVSETTTSAKTAVEEFINYFNDLQTYLEAKTGVVATSQDEETGNLTYTRGALADDNVFSDLRSELFSIIMDEYDNDGTFSQLREIGITIDNSLKLSISDSDAFDSAMSSDLDGVSLLMDKVMAEIDAKLAVFTGVRSGSDYIDDVKINLGNEINEVNSDIDDMNDFLSGRELYLYNQYAQIQSQLISLQYMQQIFSSLSGTSSSSVSFFA